MTSDVSSGPAAQELLLRPEVSVGTSDDSVEVGFAHWRTRIPIQTVQESEELRGLLDGGRISAARLNGGAAELAKFLEAQGCFIPEAPTQLPCRDVLTLFQPLRSQLYAHYYAHPLWHEIRSGAASPGTLMSWVVHNYHISRSAGPIAARMSTWAEHHRTRQFFRQDALEEYWHCDAFYFAKGYDLSLAPEQVKSYVALPGSTAFEDLALNTAQHDWLGHLLIAYFQESSIIFHEHSEDFYDAVEAAYSIRGFFKGWRRHMALDVDEGHADGLADMFAHDTVVTREHVERSVRKVQLAQFYLHSALTQIQAQPDQARAAVDGRLPAAFARRHPGSDRIAPADRTALLQALREASFTALAFARRHDDIIKAGRAAAQLTQWVQDQEPEWPSSSNPWTVATGNFVLERSTSFPAFAALAGALLQCVAPDGSGDEPETGGLRSALHWLASEVEAGDFAVEQAQLAELMQLVATGVSLEPLTVARFSD